MHVVPHRHHLISISKNKKGRKGVKKGEKCALHVCIKTVWQLRRLNT